VYAQFGFVSQVELFATMLLGNKEREHVAAALHDGDFV
jgi:hypothetical protein